MTTIAEPVGRATHELAAGRRIWNVVKLHYSNRWNMLALPWIVLGVIVAINIAIWLIILASSGWKANLEGTQWSGGTTYIFVYMIIVAVQSINLTFPFALGFSVTRRDYYLGTALAFILQAAMFTVGFVLLSFIEQLTHGWFMGGHLFTPVYFGDSVWSRLFTVFALFLLCFFVGIVAATFYVRWKMNGIIVLGIGVALIALVAFAVISLSQSWGAVGQWFVDSGPVGILAWSLIPTAVSAVGGYLVLRRATPKG
jgi:hypothetical protein